MPNHSHSHWMSHPPYFVPENHDIFHVLLPTQYPTVRYAVADVPESAFSAINGQMSQIVSNSRDRRISFTSLIVRSSIHQQTVGNQATSKESLISHRQPL